MFYHHVKDLAIAKQAGHAALTVSPDNFKRHLQYLKDKGYKTVSLSDLLNYLNQDDGYDDFAAQAYPLLQQFNFKAIVFLSTG